MNHIADPPRGPHEEPADDCINEYFLDALDVEVVDDRIAGTSLTRQLLLLPVPITGPVPSALEPPERPGDQRAWRKALRKFSIPGTIEASRIEGEKQVWLVRNKQSGDHGWPSYRVLYTDGSVVELGSDLERKLGTRIARSLGVSSTRYLPGGTWYWDHTRQELLFFAAWPLGGAVVITPGKGMTGDIGIDPDAIGFREAEALAQEHFAGPVVNTKTVGHPRVRQGSGLAIGWEFRAEDPERKDRLSIFADGTLHDFSGSMGTTEWRSAYRNALVPGQIVLTHAEGYLWSAFSDLFEGHERGKPSPAASAPGCASFMFTHAVELPSIGYRVELSETGAYTVQRHGTDQVLSGQLDEVPPNKVRQLARQALTQAMEQQPGLGSSPDWSASYGVPDNRPLPIALDVHTFPTVEQEPLLATACEDGSMTFAQGQEVLHALRAESP